MKSDTTTTVLNFVLVLLAVFGVVCAILTFTRTREFRLLSNQATVDNELIMRVQSLGGEVNAYYQKTPTPELKSILQPSSPAKPAAK